MCSVVPAEGAETSRYVFVRGQLARQESPLRACDPNAAFSIPFLAAMMAAVVGDVKVKKYRIAPAIRVQRRPRSRQRSRRRPRRSGLLGLASSCPLPSLRFSPLPVRVRRLPPQCFLAQCRSGDSFTLRSRPPDGQRRDALRILGPNRWPDRPRAAGLLRSCAHRPRSTDLPVTLSIPSANTPTC